MLSHELALTVHDFVAVTLQGTGGVLIWGDFEDDVLVVTRRIGDSAIGFTFPGTENFGEVTGRTGLSRGADREEQKKASSNGGGTHGNARETEGSARHGQRIAEFKGIVI